MYYVVFLFKPRIGYSSCDGLYIYRNLFITLLFSLKQCYNETCYEEVMVYMQPFSIKYGTTCEPAHEIMILIAYANSQGSGATAHPRNHARAFAVRTHVV